MDSVKNTNKDEAKVINNATGQVGTVSDKKEEDNKTNEETAIKTGEETTKEDEKAAGTTFQDPVKEEVTEYGVYNAAGEVVKIFNNVNHGKDFKKIAEAYAERNKMTAKPYVAPLTPEELETDVVHVVTSNDQPKRSFSLVVHGKDYKKIAAQFVEKYGIKKGYKIKK